MRDKPGVSQIAVTRRKLEYLEVDNERKSTEERGQDIIERAKSSNALPFSARRSNNRSIMSACLISAWRVTAPILWVKP